MPHAQGARIERGSWPGSCRVEAGRVPYQAPVACGAGSAWSDIPLRQVSEVQGVGAAVEVCVPTRSEFAAQEPHS